MDTIRQIISSTKGKLKAVNADYRLPNKFVWSVIKDNMRWLIAREDNKLSIISNSFLFQTLKCVEVEEAPSIDDCCGVRSRCTVFRTKLKLPKIHEGYTGRTLIKSVYTIDGSMEFTEITIQQYIRKLENPNSKYDKGNYYYYNNGYLYFPKSRIRKVMVKSYFEDDIKDHNYCNDNEPDACRTYLDDDFRFPDKLRGELLSYVMKDLAPSRQIPDDTQIDKNSNNIR